MVADKGDGLQFHRADHPECRMTVRKLVALLLAAIVCGIAITDVVRIRST
jgi:hypothetical protein